MDVQNLRWWGWGTLDQSYPLDDRPQFWPTLRKWLELPDQLTETPPVSLDQIELRPSRLDDPVLTSLWRLLDDGSVHTGKLQRVLHAYGKSYRDLVRVRAGRIPNPPDAVIYPANERQVAAFLAWAAEREIAVIPFGGGSSVLGGVEPAPRGQPTITLDLARLNRLVLLDGASHTATIQAGARGPDLEAALNAQGFSLGHFPQSFEFSTLGGWIATRAAGHTSIGYGKIEDLTQRVRMVTPTGILETRDTPATAAGPSLLQLLVGSEGTYGVITEATLRVHPLPAVQDYRGILFRDFDSGIHAFRDLMQSGLRPAMIRLSDPPETAAYAAMARAHRGWKRLRDRLATWYLGRQGYDLSQGSLMLVGLEGTPGPVAQRWKRALEICHDHGGLSLGRSVSTSWMRERYTQPYLRDTLLGYGILVDTLETATTWAKLRNLYDAMTAAMHGAIAATGGGPGLVMTHISHAYAQGASLYTTFLGRQVPGQEEEQWWAIKRAATEAILEAGGTLTHHHGIGADHAPWLEEEVGPVGMAALRALKRTFDPQGIMNPGILLTDE